jgi:hypothetical protein
MSSKQDYIIINKPTATTTKELYSNTYSKQSLEILKLTVGFLLSQLLLKILNEAVFDNFYNNKVLLVILIIVFAVSIYLVGTELFTYIKIQSDKEQLLKDLSR